MRNNRNIEFSTKQTDRDKFANSAHPNSIGLYKTRRAGLQVIFENDSVWHMLTQGKFCWVNRICKYFVCQYIIRMRRFLNPIRPHALQFSTYFDRLWQSPLLVGIQHYFYILSGDFTCNVRTTDIALRISTTYLKLHGSKAFSNGLFAIFTNLFITITEPSDRSIVTRITRFKYSSPFLFTFQIIL